MRRTRQEMQDAMGITGVVMQQPLAAAGVESTRPLLEEVQIEVAEEAVRILTRQYDDLARRRVELKQPNRLEKIARVAAQVKDFRQAVKREIRNRPGVTPWVDWMGRTRLCADNDLLRV